MSIDLRSVLGGVVAIADIAEPAAVARDGDLLLRLPEHVVGQEPNWPALEIHTADGRCLKIRRAQMFSDDLRPKAVEIIAWDWTTTSSAHSRYWYGELSFGGTNADGPQLPHRMNGQFGNLALGNPPFRCHWRLEGRHTYYLLRHEVAGPKLGLVIDTGEGPLDSEEVGRDLLILGYLFGSPTSLSRLVGLTTETGGHVDDSRMASVGAVSRPYWSGEALPLPKFVHPGWVSNFFRLASSFVREHGPVPVLVAITQHTDSHIVTVDNEFLLSWIAIESIVKWDRKRNGLG